jgi:hypothetical protein
VLWSFSSVWEEDVYLLEVYVTLRTTVLMDQMKFTVVIFFVLQATDRVLMGECAWKRRNGLMVWRIVVMLQMNSYTKARDVLDTFVAATNLAFHPLGSMMGLLIVRVMTMKETL